MKEKHFPNMKSELLEFRGPSVLRSAPIREFHAESMGSGGISILNKLLNGR